MRLGIDLALRALGAAGRLPNYLLLERFNTAQAAPLPTNMAPDPGPGSLVIADTENKQSVSGGRFVVSGGKAVSAWGDPRAVAQATVLTRKMGLALIATVNTTAVTTTNGWIIGLSQSPGPTTQSAQGWRVNSSGWFVRESSVNLPLVNLVALQNGTDIEFMSVLRSVGGFALHRNAGQALWTLDWVNVADTSTPVYPAMMNNDAAVQVDNMRVVDLSTVSVRFVSDYALATSRISGAGTSAQTFACNADCILDYTQTTLPSSGSLEVGFRVQDDNNLWKVGVSSTGAITLTERVAGVDTARGTAAGVVSAGHRITVTVEGTTIKVYSNNTFRFTYASAANFQTIAQGKIGTISSGSISNIVAWPRFIALPVI